HARLLRRGGSGRDEADPELFQSARALQSGEGDPVGRPLHGAGTREEAADRPLRGVVMVRKLAVLVAGLSLLSLPGCGKSIPAGLSGSSAFRMKDPVWATFGWSRGRMIYAIYFVPNSATAFNPDGV